MFGENDLLNHVTPNDPRLTFDPIIEIKGIKLMYGLYGHAMQHGGLSIFCEYPFDPSDSNDSNLNLSR